MATAPLIPNILSPESTDAYAAVSETALQDLLNTPPIDLESLLENCLGKPLFATSLLEEFAKTADRRVDTFEQQIRQGNLQAVAELAHAFKGVADILCASALRKANVDIEAASQNGDLALSTQFIQKLRREVQRIQHDIPNLRMRLGLPNVRV